MAFEVGGGLIGHVAGTKHPRHDRRGVFALVDLLIPFSNSCAQIPQIQARLEALVRYSADSEEPDGRSDE